MKIITGTEKEGNMWLEINLQGIYVRKRNLCGQVKFSRFSLEMYVPKTLIWEDVLIYCNNTLITEWESVMNVCKYL